MAETKRMTAEQVVSYLLEEDGLDFLRESLTWVVQQLMEAEVSELVGAARGERAPEERLTHRNGYRARTWATRAGEIELAIPKIRRGSYFPSFLEPRRRSRAGAGERGAGGLRRRRLDPEGRPGGRVAGAADLQERGLADLRRASTSRSRRSATGRSEGRYPYLWLDAKVEKVRDGGRVVRKALVLAYGVHESGYREVIGLDVGEAETEAFWRSFLRGLVERGLTGVQLVVSDAHAGLKKAIAQVLGCPWQRCTVHFLREALGHARREQQPMLAALIRPIFNADDGEQARELVGAALERLAKPLPKIARAARRGRGRPARLLRLPGRPLAEAALDEPARAGQPRDRPPHRRRRDLPQRPLPDPARRQRRDRAERRMARRQPLPQPALAGRDPHRLQERQQQKGSPQSSPQHEHPTSYTTPRDLTREPGSLNVRRGSMPRSLQSDRNSRDRRFAGASVVTLTSREWAVLGSNQ